MSICIYMSISIGDKLANPCVHVSLFNCVFNDSTIRHMLKSRVSFMKLRKNKLEY